MPTPKSIVYETAMDPALSWKAITKSDSTEHTNLRGLYVGNGGDVNLVGDDGVAAVWPNVQSGSILPVGPVKVMSTSTTASGFVGCY